MTSPTPEPRPNDPAYASPETSPGAYPTGVPSDDERLWAMLAHLAGLLGYAVAFGQYIAPLVIYLVYKDKSRFVAFHALQELYLQLALLVFWLLIVVVTIVTCGAGVVLAFVVAAATIVLPIIAAIKAHAGEWFEYWLVGPWARSQVGV